MKKGRKVVRGSRDNKKVHAGVQLTPENRLFLPMFAGVLFPVTMFWFGWSANYNSVHWIVPTIAGTFLSTAILLIFVGYLNYLTDCYLFMAASAIAGNTVARSACAAASPLFTDYMFNSLGVGGGGSLVGGVAILLAVSTCHLKFSCLERIVILTLHSLSRSHLCSTNTDSG